MAYHDLRITDDPYDPKLDRGVAIVGPVKALDDPRAWAVLFLWNPTTRKLIFLSLRASTAVSMGELRARSPSLASWLPSYLGDLLTIAQVRAYQRDHD